MDAAAREWSSPPRRRRRPSLTTLPRPRSPRPRSRAPRPPRLRPRPGALPAPVPPCPAMTPILSPNDHPFCRNEQPRGVGGHAWRRLTRFPSLIQFGRRTARSERCSRRTARAQGVAEGLRLDPSPPRAEDFRRELRAVLRHVTRGAVSRRAHHRPGPVPGDGFSLRFALRRAAQPSTAHHRRARAVDGGYRLWMVYLHSRNIIHRDIKSEPPARRSGP